MNSEDLQVGRRVRLNKNASLTVGFGDRGPIKRKFRKGATGTVTYARVHEGLHGFANGEFKIRFDDGQEIDEEIIEGALWGQALKKFDAIGKRSDKSYRKGSQKDCLTLKDAKERARCQKLAAQKPFYKKLLGLP